MPPILYAHPFSSYCMKAMIAVHELGVAVETRMLDPEHPEHGAELARIAPAGKFPVLVAGGRAILETSVIVEWLDRVGGGGRLIPADPDAALEARMLDRVLDAYVMTPMQAIVTQARRPEGQRDPIAREEARATLTRAYAWLDAALGGRRWTAGDAFGLADCAAAPALLYAHWVQPIPAALATLAAHRARLLARPSVARVVEDARPYRRLFPLPVPEGD